MTPGGNWEGHTILRRVTPRGSAEDEAALARSRQVLFEARARRVRPGRDDKVLADWNGLAIAAPGACRGACSGGPTGSRAPRRRTTSCWPRCRDRMAACSTPGGSAA